MSNMNISPQSISGTCKLKCAYSFNYQVSNTTVTNYGTSLNLTYETAQTPPVTYNNGKYNVSNITIYSPSLHTFNGSKAGAEIAITHSPPNGGNSLTVCVPINTTGSTTEGSKILNEIISAVSNGAPAQGENVSQGISEFTLNDIIPMTHFLTYENSQNGGTVIAYAIQNAISITPNSLTLLQKSISPSSITIPSGPLLFLNPTGPTNGTPSGDIYIDCQPTNTSEEEINMVVDTKSATTYDIGNIFQNQIFILLLSSVGFIIILLGLHMLFMYLSSGQLELAKFFRYKKIYNGHNGS